MIYCRYFSLNVLFLKTNELPVSSRIVLIRPSR
jgi:hypothetical protein